MSDSYKVYASQEYVDNKIKEIDTSVDWNAKEGEPGYIENRTHYEEGGIFEHTFQQELYGTPDYVVNFEHGYVLSNFGMHYITDKKVAFDELNTSLTLELQYQGEKYPIEYVVDSNLILNDKDWHCAIRWNPEPIYSAANGNLNCSLVLSYFATAGDKTEFYAAAYENPEPVYVTKPGLYVSASIAMAMLQGKLEAITFNLGEYSLKTLDNKFLSDDVVIAAPVKAQPAVTVLNETVCELIDDDGDGSLESGFIPGRWENDFEEGRIYKVNYNGTEYNCKALLTEVDGASMYLLGNTEVEGFPGGNSEAPFVIAAVPNSFVDANDSEFCAMIMPIGVPTSLTISITADEVSLNPQYLVMDSDGNIKWQDRTHWDDLSIIVPKGDYPGDLNGTYITTLPIHPIEEGRIYTVEMEGIVFETTFTKIYSEDYGLSYASEEYRDEENRWCQISLLPNNSTSRFYGHILSGGFGGTGTPTFESANDGSFTQNIYIHAGSIKTLDSKYLAAAPSNSKITILPKTTLTVLDPNDPGDGAPITTPFAEYPSAGDIWNVTYNGIEYACELIDASTVPNMEVPFPEGAVYLGGNLTAAGFTHIASNNEAPFIIMAVGSEEFAVEMAAYGAIMPIVTLDQTFTVSITKGSQMVPQQLTLCPNGEMIWEERPFYEIEGQGTLEVNLSTAQNANISFSPYIPNALNGDWPLIADFVPSLESFKKANITITDASGVRPITDRLVFQIGDDYIYNIVYDNDDENALPYICFVVCSTAGDKTELIKQVYPSCQTAEVPVPGIYVEPWPFIIEASTSITVDFGAHIIKTIEPKFLPETVVQAEPLAKGEVILEETALEIVEVNPGEHEILLTTPWKQDLVAGRAYTVTYNGQAYTCEAVSFAEVAPGVFDSAILLGNLAAIDMEHSGSNSNAPFAMLAIPNEFAANEGAYGMFIPLDDSTEMIISVSSGSSGTPQWLVADSDSNIKWEDRTHWAEKNKGELLGETFLSIVIENANGTGRYGHSFYFNNNPEVEKIEEMYFEWNGKTYYSKVAAFEESIFAFGNLSLCPEPGKNLTTSDCPVYGWLMPPDAANYENASAVIFDTVSREQATFNSWRVVEIVHKLDSKYLDLSSVEKFWYPVITADGPSIIYENNNIVLAQASPNLYSVDTRTIGLNTVDFNNNKLYTILADEEEFTAFVHHVPGDMDITNTNIVQAYNASTGHILIMSCPPSGGGVAKMLQSNFNFTSLVVKDPYTVAMKIPSSLVEGTTALKHGHGYGSVCSLHGTVSASGDSSFAFGDMARATAYSTFAFGNHAEAHGNGSASFGYYVSSSDANQFTIGRGASLSSDGAYPFVVADGSMNPEDGKNIHALAWTGDAYHTGDVYVQGDGTTAGFDGAKKVATEEYVNNAIINSVSNGLVLTDEATGQKYRVFINNGTLNMEAVN